MFYDEFVKLCNSKGKSPTAVAKEIGLAGAHVTKWKKGSTPTDATAYKICDYFGLPHDYFKKEKTPAAESSERPRLRSVARLESSDITPEMDKHIADYIEFLLNKNKGK